MIVRPETVSDYPTIAEVNVLAFGKGREALIVSLHRHRRDFDPSLSLVAEIDGVVVGHALFSPRTIRLMDADVPAVTLGPIAVLPPFQGRGIGAALIEDGHRAAAARGKALSFLIGHRTYYPRFGYRMHAYGRASVDVPVVSFGDSAVKETPVGPEDPTRLRELWSADEGAVDFAIDPGEEYMAWVSPHPDIRSSVFRDGNEIAGYVRYSQSSPHQPHVFLSRDPVAARSIAAILAQKSERETLTLPVHPRSRSAAAFGPGMLEPIAAAMARELVPGALTPYFNAVERRPRSLGRVIWPVEFDL